MIRDIESDVKKAAKATRTIDKVLAKSEKPRKAKPPRDLSALRKGSSKAEAREHEAYLRSLLNSPDPNDRESARKALGL